MRRTIGLSCLGLVTFILSEPMFWGGWSVAYPSIEIVFTALVYTSVVTAALFAAQCRGARGPAGLVLTGALVGWLVEGVVVTTTYENLPISISWTGLGWHALVTVLGGWWLLPKVLSGRRPVSWMALVGVGWGAGWREWRPIAGWRSRSARWPPTPR